MRDERIAILQSMTKLSSNIVSNCLQCIWTSLQVRCRYFSIMIERPRLTSQNCISFFFIICLIALICMFFWISPCSMLYQKHKEQHQKKIMWKKCFSLEYIIAYTWKIRLTVRISYVWRFNPREIACIGFNLFFFTDSVLNGDDTDARFLWQFLQTSEKTPVDPAVPTDFDLNYFNNPNVETQDKIFNEVDQDKPGKSWKIILF